MEFFIITSPNLGPLLMAFNTSGVVWRAAFWLFTAPTGVALTLVLFFDEAVFDRS